MPQPATSTSSQYYLLDSIRLPVLDDLLAVNHLIEKELISSIPLIQTITQHIVQSGGKRLRPLLVLLSAKACGYSEDLEHHELATIVEFIHTATLLHDDVVDASDLRRGKKSANALFGNQASILVGDFLYSRAFQLLAKRNNIPIMRVLAHTTNQIAEGELWQLMNRHDADIDETTYHQVIRRKTAELFAAAAQVGAIIGSDQAPIRQAMKTFGLHLGMAYQMIDDLLDYSADPHETGKNIGGDLAEGKVTLPLIYAKQRASVAQAKQIRRAIQEGGFNNLEEILTLIESTQAKKYTLQCAQEEAQLAQSQLHLLNPSPYRDALKTLTEFVVSRHF